MSTCPPVSTMDNHGHRDDGLEASIKGLSRFNLKENPFQVFELFEQGLDKQSLKRDEVLFERSQGYR